MPLASQLSNLLVGASPTNSSTGDGVLVPAPPEQQDPRDAQSHSRPSSHRRSAVDMTADEDVEAEGRPPYIHVNTGPRTTFVYVG